MKKLMLIAVLGTTTPFAFAGNAEFSEVDTNDDGVLSTTEAKMALPEILIVDNNNDGMLNPSEAEVAVPGLMLSTTSEEEKTTAFVGEDEYESIVEAIAQLNTDSEAENKS